MKRIVLLSVATLLGLYTTTIAECVTTPSEPFITDDSYCISGQCAGELTYTFTFHCYDNECPGSESCLTRFVAEYAFDYLEWEYTGSCTEPDDCELGNLVNWTYWEWECYCD